MDTATVYVDGFNLYFRCLQYTPYKWLDLAKLAALLLPNSKVVRIRYFTAHIQARAYDPNAPTRQQIFLRALATIPNLTIHLGQLTRCAAADLASVRAQRTRPARGIGNVGAKILSATNSDRCRKKHRHEEE